MIGYLIGGQLGKRFGGKATIVYAAVGTAVHDDSLGIDGRNVEQWSIYDGNMVA